MTEGTITFIKPLTNPKIDRIDPTSGSVNGGTPVYIYGSDFRQNAKVYIGGKEAEIKDISLDGSTIRIYTPAADPAIVGILRTLLCIMKGITVLL